MSTPSYSVGDRVWIPHDEHAWLAGRIASLTPALEVKTEHHGIIKLKSTQLKTLEPCGSHVDQAVENLVDLDELSEGAILHHVRKRYISKKIYTSVGSILVATNPFENLPIYREEDIQQAYKHTTPYPHVFVTAAIAFAQCKSNQKDQAVLISGESGAGKTETTKRVLSFLSSVGAAKGQSGTADEIKIEDKILQSNPLLEALGNAKTLRNNNSSRFGKWMKVEFDKNFTIMGCEIVNYLLEKSRVVTQSAMERNYHIFYQLIAGATQAQQARFDIKPAGDYNYLNQSGCMSVEGIDDVQEWKDVQEAMKTLQFTTDMQSGMFQLLLAILNLGNVTFVSGTGSKSASCSISPATKSFVDLAVSLLGVDESLFTKALTEKKVKMGTDTVDILLNNVQAKDSIDSLTKALYSAMFDWVIKQANVSLSAPTPSAYFIGILDIFGFEVFETNRFEQLCINYANEKLQQHFNSVIFDEEMKMYASEGIDAGKNITFVDNSACVNLIEGKPFGLLSLLEEECSLGTATDFTYISKVDKEFGKGKKNENIYFLKHKTVPELFSVKHFAGAVEYNVVGILERNKDVLSDTLRTTMCASSIPFIAELLRPPDSDASGGPKSPGGKKEKVAKTLGGQFRNQLIGLVANLKLTEPHFIRCVKPNHAKKPTLFDGTLALRQLRYAGLFEAIRIRQSGYAYRCTLDAFARQYTILVDGLLKEHKTGKKSSIEACQMILEKFTADRVLVRDQWHVGTSRVFMKSTMCASMLEQYKAKRVIRFAILIQSKIRMFITRSKVWAAKYAAQAEAEKARLAAEKERLANLAHEERVALHSVIVQKYARRYITMRAMSSLQDLVLLRRVLAKRDVSQVQEIVRRLEERTGGSDYGGGGGGQMRFSNVAINSLSSMFNKEIKIAKTLVRLIELQNTFVEDVESATLAGDVLELNRLIVKSRRLEMQQHPCILRAHDRLVQLYQKRTVVQQLVAFVKDENENGENVLELIDEAKALGVDSSFIQRVQNVYDSAGPRIRTRNRLRRAIETIDKEDLLVGVTSVVHVQETLYPGFAELERRAAVEILNLLHIEDQLENPTGTPVSIGNADTNALTDTSMKEKEAAETETETGPRLPNSIIKLCDEISQCRGVINTLTTVAPTVISIETQAKLNRNFSGDRTQGTRRSSNVPVANGPKDYSDKIALDAALAHQKALKARLLEMCDHDFSKRTRYIRYYKWSKLYSIWKYPEVCGSGGSGVSSSGGGATLSPKKHTLSNTTNEEFFGLQFDAAHSNIYLLKTLHKDVDQSYGDTSGTIQAALGGMNLPATVSQSLKYKDEDFTIQGWRSRGGSSKGSTDGSPSRQRLIMKADLVKTSTARKRTEYTAIDKDLEDQLLQSRRNKQRSHENLLNTLRNININREKMHKAPFRG